jgi:uncharacterized membrane protein (DUF106 family)
MIQVITIIVVCIIVLINIYIRNTINNKRIKELEQRLDEYYKKRENRLIKRFRDIEQQ